MTYRRVIAISEDYHFAVLATLYADGSVGGRVFGNRCCSNPEHEPDCARRLEDELQALCCRLPRIEVLYDRAADPILARFGRSRAPV